MKGKVQGKEQNAEMFSLNDRAIDELFNIIARRARRKSIFFTDRNGKYLNIIKKYNPDIHVKDISAINEKKDDTFRRVVLMEVLENYDDSKGMEILYKAWGLLEGKGRLFVIVPNEDIYSHLNQIRKYKRKHLKKILQPFGRPKLISEQPFKWLMMYVGKHTREKSNLNSAKDNRMHVISTLCHGRVLELGCGSGILTKRIRDRGLEVIGVDKNAEKINQACSTHEDIRFIQSDVLKLSLPVKSFDTVILPEILEHVPEEIGNKMFEVAWRLLKPEGRMIVSVPNENCIPHPNHIRCFTRHSLKSLLTTFGKPVLITEQPYKWLMMYVEKK